MSRLILVEGVPGAGKTTAVQNAARWLTSHACRVAAFAEGDPHPVDLAWQWWLTHAQFEAACREHPSAAAELQRCSWRSPSGVAVAYTKVEAARCHGQWPVVEAAFADAEPFGGRLAPEAFLDVLAARWADFGATASEAGAPEFVLFDGSLLQNTLVELVLFGEWEAAETRSGLSRLVSAVAPWRPVLIRLVPVDLDAAITAAQRDRVDAHGHPQWREATDRYAAGTPWARTRGVSAPGSFLAYLRHRQHLEAQVLPQLGVPWIDLPSPAGTDLPWDSVNRGLQDLLSSLID